MDVQTAFAANVKRLRQQRGLSQSALADAVGLTLQSVFSYESGAKWPRPETIDVLAKALKVRPWMLVAEAGEGGEIPQELGRHVAEAARLCGFQVVDPAMGSGNFLTSAMEAVAGQVKGKRRKKKKKQT